MLSPGSPQPSRSTIWALQALCFLMADVQAGLGPFLGVFLQSKSWEPGPIGAVMTIGGIAGMLVTAPAGAFVDKTVRKRLWLAASGVFTLAASALVFLSQEFWVVALSQAASAIAGALIGPALAGVTLGIVRQRGFNQQNGRNQAFNHAGNVVGAALSGYLGWKYGFVAVFWLAAAFGVGSILAVSAIPESAIDHKAARGLEDEDGHDKDESAQGYSILFQRKPLLILAAALAFFHLGNAAMLPLYGQAVVDAGKADPAAFTALTIVVAQGVMIVTSLVAMVGAERYGYWPVLMASFLSLPIRGVLAALFVTDWGVYPVQFLDGVGAGLQSVAVPGMVAAILSGTGRVNVGQGAVMTMQGVGAAISPLLGGALAQWFGYRPAFVVLGACAAGSVALWMLGRSRLQAAHNQPPAAGSSSPA